MPSRLISGPQGMIWDIPVWNTETTRTLQRGETAMWDVTDISKTLTMDPSDTSTVGPLPTEGLATPFAGVKLLTALEVSPAAGIVQKAIKAQEWGMIRIFGPGVAQIVNTTATTHRDAFGKAVAATIGSTGRLQHLEASSSSAYCCQLGDHAGHNTTGALRSVFIDFVGFGVGLRGSSPLHNRPLGTWTVA